MELSTRMNYLDGNLITVPELNAMSGELVIKNLRSSKIIEQSYGDHDQFYYLVAATSFSFGVIAAEQWNRDYSYLQKNVDNIFIPDIDVSVQKAYTILGAFDYDNALDEIIEYLRGLYQLLELQMRPYFNANDQVQKDMIFNGMKNFYHLGVAVHIKRMGFKQKKATMILKQVRKT